MNTVAVVSTRPSQSQRPVVTIALALTAAASTAVGLSGVGDAPDPHASAGAIGAWFVERRAEVLGSAPFGYLGAVAIVALAARLASDERRQRARPVVPGLLLAGGLLIASYLGGVHIAWTALSYRIAASSAEVAGGLFALTIVAVPVLGLGVVLLVGAVAVSTPARGRPVLRWSSAAVATVATTSLVAVADEGFWSPDVQQQVVGNVLLAWLVVLAATAALPSRSTNTHPTPTPTLESSP